jgi:lipopolysaccharide transport system permease protein
MAKDDTATRRARAVEILPGAPPLPGMGGAVRRLTANGFLLWQLSLREFTGASKGSFLGGLWSWLYPLMLLVVYSLVFSTVFKMRWGLGVPEGFASFALVLFCGFIPYNFLATVVQRSATVIVNNSGLVAKVVMPLELLPASLLVAAAIQLAITTLILLVAELVLLRTFSWGMLYALPVLLALVLLSAGFGLLIAVLGAFVRDTANLVGVVLQMLFFLTPITYPMSAVPERLQRYFMLNPLTPIVIDWRGALMSGVPPHWDWVAIEIAAGAVLTVIGYRLLLRSQRAFTEVL